MTIKCSNIRLYAIELRVNHFPPFPTAEAYAFILIQDSKLIILLLLNIFSFLSLIKKFITASDFDIYLGEMKIYLNPSITIT